MAKDTFDAIQDYIEDSAATMRQAADAIKHLVKVQQEAVQLALNYDKVIADAKNGDEGPDTYPWDIGIAP